MTLPLPQFVVDSPICTECQGSCCKNMPGMCWPDDVKPLTVERIVQMVRQERYAIDWYEGDPRLKGKLGRVLYLRPAILGVTKPLDPSWGGRCTFLTDTGCSLTPNQRPRQCLALVPIAGGYDGNKCKEMAGYRGKKSGAKAWIPHQDMMQEVENELR